MLLFTSGMDWKRRRLEVADLLRRLARSGGHSAVGLSEILAEVRRNPELIQSLGTNTESTRRAVGRAVLAAFDELKFVVKLPLHDGGEFVWEMADLALLIAASVRADAVVAAAYSEAVRRHPPSLAQPWDLCVGYDEFAPGSKLKADNRRKVMVLSCIFLQLGQCALSNSCLWHTPIAVRSGMIHAVEGGWSRMLAIFLRHALLGPSGLATVGIPLELPSGLVLIFARVSNLMTDGAGLKETFDWRGHSSFRPCFRHFNVLRKDSDLAWRRPGYCEITCADPTRFHVWTAAEIHRTVDLLAAASERVSAGTLSPAMYANLELSCSLNFNKDGLLAAVDLRSCGDLSCSSENTPTYQSNSVAVSQTACGLHIRTRPAQSNIAYIDNDCECLFVH